MTKEPIMIDDKYWEKKYADMHIRLTNENSELREQLKRKEQECERWKNKYRKSIANMTVKEIDQSTYIKQLEKVINRIRTERDNYKQTLEEIKEMCKQKLPAGLSAQSCYESFEAFTGYILQKISEVLKDEKI